MHHLFAVPARYKIVNNCAAERDAEIELQRDQPQEPDQANKLTSNNFMLLRYDTRQD